MKVQDPRERESRFFFKKVIWPKRKKKKTKKKMSIVLSARHEAAIIAYIALYDNCDKARCWRRIGSAIKKHGVRVTRTVYRGHARRDRSIRLVTPFFSTTPKKQMAELFVEKEWSGEANDRTIRA